MIVWSASVLKTHQAIKLFRENDLTVIFQDPPPTLKIRVHYTPEVSLKDYLCEVLKVGVSETH